MISKDDVIRLAKQVGVDATGTEYWPFFIEELEAFAKLVAEHEQSTEQIQPSVYLNTHQQSTEQDCVAMADYMALMEKYAALKAQQPVSWESILGAIDRAYYYEENANKTIALELAVAIAKEVQALFTQPPQSEARGLSQEAAPRKPLKVDKDGWYWLSENECIHVDLIRKVEAAHGITGEKE